MKMRIVFTVARRAVSGLVAVVLTVVVLLLESSIPSTGKAAATVSSVPPAVYDSRYDLDHDSDIDIVDIMLVASHWGAIGTWSGDCAAIQEAINALPVTGGQVVIQAGTFICTTPIVIDRDNVDLRGQGSATVLRLADGANSPVLVLGQTIMYPTMARTNIRVSDLTIDGNRENQTVECWGGPCDTGGLTYIRNNGITLRGVSDVLVERVTVTRARSGGLVSEKGSRRVTVHDLASFDNYFDGLAAYETEDSIFSQLQIYDNAYAGISLDIRFNNNIISDAVITGNGRQGIFMRDSRDNLFQGIQIRNSGEQGVFLAQVDTDPTKPASGNTFSEIIISGSVAAGLRVNDASCVNNSVVASQFVANQGGCISEETPGLVQALGNICR